jgi:HAD superfamily hydrolase (TIGR01509 family)
MTQTIIFDLSEVLIAGLLGVEQTLAQRLSMPPETILAALGGDLLNEICQGAITEEHYLARILASEKWDVSESELKQTIRENFHHRVAGMDGVLEKLAAQRELFLLSDHAREWAGYIQDMHPFLRIFRARFFSYELRQVKKDPSTFTRVLQLIQREPEECLLIDDSPTNIASAASVGIKGIRFENAAQLSSNLAGMNLS